MIQLILYAIGIIVIIGILFLLNFCRDPKRKIPKGNDIVSPADGTVINIIKTTKASLKVKKGYIGKINAYTKDIANECYIISIFMSMFDVHYNRAPIEGKIISTKHTKGKFFAAYDLEKSLMNEKNEIVIKNKKLKIRVIQIAGFLARRIFCYVKKNQNVNKGQKIGFISLGSQATLIIPAKKIKIIVKEGQKVKAGSTIIAELR